MATDNIADTVIACSIVMVLIVAIIVILRLFTRWKILNFAGREDWFILAALVFSPPNLRPTFTDRAYCTVLLGHKYYRDVLSDQITKFLKAFYFTVLSYNISQTLAKISILLLYLRLFSVTNIRKACYTILVIVILFGIWLFFTTILFFNASLNILIDVGIVLLPMPVIRTLVLPGRQRLRLYFIFTLGFLYDNLGISNWSSIELNTAIICPCLTTLKPLLSHYFPHIFSTGNSSNKFDHQYGEGVDAESNISSSKAKCISEIRRKSKAAPSDSDVGGDGRCFEGVGLESLEPVIARPGKEIGSS
ncbi:hypothetical protein BDZ45DRAFT_735558 [Acephala macrosclerotiorum]|nr:hypothetical protein BDZ45DRAFT_735558 [Acephala macrosclerotiorum]